MNSTANRQDRAAEEAALAWIARLRSDTVSEADRRDFALWLAESDSHCQAMDAAEALWGELGIMLQAQPQQTRSFFRVVQRSWIPAAVATAATLMLAVLFWTGGNEQPAGDIYRTAMGERADIELPDGSHALLNTETVIRVVYSDDQRYIDLQRGQAWFSVQKDKSKPFEVDAGNTRVTALGTAFDVYVRDTATEVTVTEGVVSVTELGAVANRAPRVELLHLHQSLQASPGEWDVSQQSELSVQQRLAWREGRLVADGIPLSDLIAQLQRYYPTTYLLGSPGLSTLTVSGVFDLEQPQSIVRALEVSLQLEARQLDEDTVQLVKITPID
ncbi:FecR family protein [Haliea sp. E17]|uniref:FecR family protein n=1 Tax=Haliea sp. E17 TaxID=3401576 RepID=UPI003AABC155